MSTPSQGYDSVLTELEARARFAMKPHDRPAEKLDPLRKLLARLGHPERQGQIVHIAGTNGKGTTAEMVSRLLRQSGKSVGLYTSPHLIDLRERVRVNGALAPTELFASAAERVLVEQARMAQGEALSYFDLLTAIGFTVFREMGTDWIVLETGLGGAADSTNVTETKALSILTPIGHDHMTVLGADLRSIARQKMGIARPGTPLVLFRQREDLHDWMAEQLKLAGAPVTPGDGIVIREVGAPSGLAQVDWPEGLSVQLTLPWHLATDPHFACCAGALSAAEVLLDGADDDARIARAAMVLETALPGRLQFLENVGMAGNSGASWRRVVLDGAHNREALLALNRALGQWNTDRYTLLITLMRDKLIEPVREPLRKLLSGAERVIGVLLPYDRAPGAGELRDFLAPLLGAPAGRASIETAGLDEALRLAARHPERPLVAAGSLWMLGDLMKRLRLPDAHGSAGFGETAAGVSDSKAARLKAGAV
jgi:dihydrofolate synthase/folylpolyglutamate synthase